MQQEWHQTDYILEDCPIHGYRITQIPVRNNYQIKRNIYSEIGGPKIFPYERNIIHSISNNSYGNTNRNNYDLNEYSNRIIQEDNNHVHYNNNYDIGGFESNKDFSDNYSFYISGTSKLKPKVTINKVLNKYRNKNIINNDINSQSNYYITSSNNRRNKIFDNNIPKTYNFNQSAKYQKTILNNFNNSNGFLRANIRRYDIYNTEPEDTMEGTNNNRRRDYYLTPNYYNNDEEGANIDTKNYHLNRNININNDIYINNMNNNQFEGRIITDNNRFQKRRIKSGYKNNNSINYKLENIPKSRIVGDIKNNKGVYIKKIYKNKENIIPRINTNNGQKYKTINQIKDKKKLINAIINKEGNDNYNKIKVKLTNLNNHKFYISNNSGIMANKAIKKLDPPISIKINKYILNKISRNLRGKRPIYKNTVFRNERNHTYNNINNVNIKNDFSQQIIKNREKNNLIGISERRNENIIIEKKELNGGKIPNNKNENVEHQIEKYYDSQGNCIGGKNIIIKKKYNSNGEKIVREIIKEEYNSNFNDLFKKYIPKNKEVDKNLAKENRKKYPFQIIENFKHNINNLEEQNKEEKYEDDDKNRNVTFGVKSDNLRFELEDKEEKEADEQQILINSEFEEEESEAKDNDKKNKNNNNEEEEMNKKVLNNKKDNINFVDNGNENESKKDDNEKIKYNNLDNGKISEKIVQNNEEKKEVIEKNEEIKIEENEDNNNNLNNDMNKKE